MGLQMLETPQAFSPPAEASAMKERRYRFTAAGLFCPECQQGGACVFHGSPGSPGVTSSSWAVRAGTKRTPLNLSTALEVPVGSTIAAHSVRQLAKDKVDARDHISDVSTDAGESEEGETSDPQHVINQRDSHFHHTHQFDSLRSKGSPVLIGHSSLGFMHHSLASGQGCVGHGSLSATTPNAHFLSCVNS